MAEFEDTRKGYERGDTELSVVVHIPDPVADDDTPVLRFPSAGRVTGAILFPRTDVSASTANYIDVGLRNGGTALTGAGTVIVAAQVGGTAGLTKDTAVPIPITGTATFAENEFVVIDYDETGTVAPEFRVQINYRLDAY